MVSTHIRQGITMVVATGAEVVIAVGAGILAVAVAHKLVGSHVRQGKTWVGVYWPLTKVDIFVGVSWPLAEAESVGHGIVVVTVERTTVVTGDSSARTALSEQIKLKIANILMGDNFQECKTRNSRQLKRRSRRRPHMQRGVYRYTAAAVCAGWLKQGRRRNATHTKSQSHQIDKH